MTQTNTNSQLHYISATNSFPLTKLIELLPIDQNRQIYDNINILSATDMNELNKIIRALHQRIMMSSFTKSDENINHMICIEGMQTMLRCTQLEDSTISHALLNDSLLRIRLLLYKCPTLKVLLLLPPQEAPEYMSSLATDGELVHKPTRKRFKKNNSGILIGDYIWKYYL